jgi:hypothetical protein
MLVAASSDGSAASLGPETVDRLIPVYPSMTASLAEPGEAAETHRDPDDRAAQPG